MNIKIGIPLLPPHDPGRMTPARAREEANYVKRLIKSGDEFKYNRKTHPATGRRIQAAKEQKQADGITLKQAIDRKLTEVPVAGPTEFKNAIKRRFERYMTRQITELTPNAIRAAWKPQSAYKQSFAYLSSVLNFVQGEDDLPAIEPEVFKKLKVCMKQFKDQPRELSFTKAHLPGVWQAINEITPEEPYRDWMVFILLTAMRRKQASELNWDGVDFTDRSISVFNSKGNRTHYLPMTNHVYAMLKRRYEASTAHPSTEELVFGAPELDGGVITARQGSSSIARVVTLAKKYTGSKKVNPSPHQLRKFAGHTLQSYLDKSTYVVEAILSHAPQTVSRRQYAERSDVGPLRQHLQDYENWVFHHNANKPAGSSH